MQVIRIYLKKQLLIKNYLIKHLYCKKNKKYGLASIACKFFDKKPFAKRARSETLATRNKFAGCDIKDKHYIKPAIS